MKAKWVAKVTIPKKNNKTGVGTAYPIAFNRVLTARHVVLGDDLYEPEKAELSWYQEADSPQQAKYFSSQVKGVLFESEAHDVAILECDQIPENIDFPVITSAMSGNDWETKGFPILAKNSKTKERIREGLTGKFSSVDQDESRLKLIIDDDTFDLELWKGASGAPIFDLNSNKLIGVLSHAKPKIKSPDKIQDPIKNSLLATSLSFLLKFDEFLKAIQPTPSDDYLDTKTEELVALHGLLHRKSSQFKKQYPCPHALINQFKDNKVNCLEDILDNELGLSEEGHKEFVKLFFVLLCYVDIPPLEKVGFVYQLATSTRLGAELAVAKRYGATPSLIKKEELRGAGVIPISAKEVGFSPEDSANEQIRAIANHTYRKLGNEGVNDNELEESTAHFKGINRKIKRKLEKRTELLRFELNTLTKEAENHPLLDKNCLEYIFDRLPDLPIVLYGNKNTDGMEEEIQELASEFVETFIGIDA